MSIKTKIFYLHFIGAANQTILAQHCMKQPRVKFEYIRKNENNLQNSFRLQIRSLGQFNSRKEKYAKNCVALPL